MIFDSLKTVIAWGGLLAIVLFGTACILWAIGELK